MSSDAAALKAVKESGITSPVTAAAFALGFVAGAKTSLPKQEALSAKQLEAEERGYPVQPNEVTVRFLEKVFGVGVASFELDTSMTDGGVLADAFKVSITYADAAAAEAAGKPKTCFMKCTKNIGAIQDLSVSTDVYSKEIYFYTDLYKQVNTAIRVPECYGVYFDPADKNRLQFCIVLEEFAKAEYSPFDQEKAPMKLQDVPHYLDYLAKLHSACWDIPVNTEQPGLGEYEAHWRMLNAAFPTTWGVLADQYEAVFEGNLHTKVGDTNWADVEAISDILRGPRGTEIEAAILARMRSRPRSISHGDARGANVFKSKKDETEFALIDWQMWVAGPVAYEFNQVWLNSFTEEEGVSQRFEELVTGYHATLVKLEPKAAAYKLEDLLIDIKLCFCTIWMQYVGFTVGSMEGYKDPANHQAMHNWDLLMQRNCQTLHLTGVLTVLKDFVATLPAASEA